MNENRRHIATKDILNNDRGSWSNTFGDCCSKNVSKSVQSYQRSTADSLLPSNQETDSNGATLASKEKCAQAKRGENAGVESSV